MKKIITILLLVAMLMSAAACGGSKPAITPSQPDATDTPAATETPSEPDPTERPTPEPTEEPADSGDAVIEEAVIFDQDGIVITAKGLEFSDSYYAASIKLFIENNTESNVTVSVNGIAVNGIMVPAYLYAKVASGKMSNETIDFYEDDLENVGIEQFQYIDLVFDVSDSDSYADITVSDVLTIPVLGTEDYVQEYYDQGDVLFDQDGVKLVAQTLYMLDDDYYGAELHFYIENNTGEEIVISARDISVNGLMIDGYFYPGLLSNTVSYVPMTFYAEDLTANDIDDITEIECYFNVYSAETYKDIFVTDVFTITF